MTTHKKASVVIVGGGGREHAIALKLVQSPSVGEIICMPGNPGMSPLAKRVQADLSDTGDLAKQIASFKPDLVVIGPEKPLADGLTDLLAKEDITVFGPSKYAARIEAFKSFAKSLMRRAMVPTAHSVTCDSLMLASHQIRNWPTSKLVIKADGLCAGKGVFVCESKDEAIAHAKALMMDGKCGESGRSIVIEDRLYGTEISLMALTDGKNLAFLPSAQDYKRLEDGDKGPMTGGMGAVSPSPLVNKRLLWEAETRIFRPVLEQMAEEGSPFRGVLYAGLMRTKSGRLAVLEFNCRFGDPEAQVVLPRVRADLYPWLYGCATGKMPRGKIPVSDHAAVCVVLCSEGYADDTAKKPKSVAINGLDQIKDTIAFHAGTDTDTEGKIVTKEGAGRILGITAARPTIKEASDYSYRVAERVTFAGKTCRSDIGANL